MARARMLSRSITDSERFASLSGDSPRLLFLLLIAHADNLGRLRGEPVQVKGLLYARNPAKVDQIDKWLGELAKSGLIQWYIHQNQRFIQIERWFDHQKLHHTAAKHSELPDPTVSEPYTNGELTVRSPLVRRELTHDSRLEVEVEVEGEYEGEKETEAPSRGDGQRVSVAEWFEAVFWPAYPRRRNVSKADALAEARKLFAKLTPEQGDELGDAIISGLVLYGKAVSGSEERFIVHPERWLKERRWETANESTTSR